MRPKFDFVERRAGEMLKQMAEKGERDPGGRDRIELRPATQLADLDITNRASVAGVTPHTLRHSIGSTARFQRRSTVLPSTFGMLLDDKKITDTSCHGDGIVYIRE